MHIRLMFNLFILYLLYKKKKDDIQTHRSLNFIRDININFLFFFLTNMEYEIWNSHFKWTSKYIYSWVNINNNINKIQTSVDIWRNNENKLKFCFKRNFLLLNWFTNLHFLLIFVISFSFSFLLILVYLLPFMSSLSKLWSKYCLHTKIISYFLMEMVLTHLLFL